MRRIVSILFIVCLLVGLTVPAFAEDKGRLVAVIFINEETDEQRADRLFERDREMGPDLWHPGETYPGLDEMAPDYTERELTPEEIAAHEESLREENRWQKNERDAMMELVFQDGLGGAKIPDDSFNGEYGEYKGKNGATTRVYDNGSVITKYADGSGEGFDTWNNHYVVDKDGNQTVYLNDGNVLIGKTDSEFYEIHKPDGSVVIPHEDGSYTWKNQSGVVVEYDAYDERTAIGFDGGEKLELVDGMFPQGDGKITGPNGAELNWHNGLTDNGDLCYSFDVTGTDGATGKANYDPFCNYRVDEEATAQKRLESNGEYKGHISTDDTCINISGMDGSAYDITINNFDSDRISVLYENPAGDVYKDKYLGNGMFEKGYESADGTQKYELSLNGEGLNGYYRDETGEHTLYETTVDDDGNVVIRCEDGGQFTVNGETGSSDYTNPDGTSIRVTNDGENQTVEYNNPALGASYTQVNGELVSADGPIGDGYSLTLRDGEMTITDESGVKTEVTRYDDGTMIAILPDGTELSKAPGGDWLRDGDPMPPPAGRGFEETEEPEEADEPEETEPEETEEPEDTDETEAEETEDEETDVEETESEQTEPEETGLSAARVSGTYMIGGTMYYVDEVDPEFSGSEYMSGALTVSAAGDYALSFSYDGYDFGSHSYDPEAGVSSFTDEGVSITITFTENAAGAISVSLSFSSSDEDGYSKGTLTGSKA